jgi:archaellum component FlaG (FlaF/FlaG flagellin family)
MASDATFSENILFIASLVVAVSIAGMIMGVTAMMADEVRVKAEASADEMGSSIVVINDPRHMPYADGQLTLYVKNVGVTSPPYKGLIVLLDGEYVEYDATLLNGSGNAWPRGSVLEIVVNANVASGDHTIKVILPNGASDTFVFRL